MSAPQETDWAILGIGLGFVAAVAVGATLAAVHGRWDLLATGLGSVAVTAAVLIFFGTRK